MQRKLYSGKKKRHTTKTQIICECVCGLRRKGAVIGAVAGGAASGAGVAAVDKVDNDNNVTGLGHGATPEIGHGHTAGVTGDDSNVTRDGDTIIVDNRTQ